MNKLKKLFSYSKNIPNSVRIASFLWLFPTIFSILVIPYIIVKGLNLDLVLYTAFMGISGLLISYGLSHLKRWAVYLFGAIIVLSFFITGAGSTLFLIVFLFLLPHWRKFN